MGQFIEFFDEKGRFIELYYDVQATGNTIQSYQFSTKRLEHEHKGNYEYLELLCKAQDMCEDFGMNLYMSGTLEKELFDDNQLLLGFKEGDI